MRALGKTIVILLSTMVFVPFARSADIVVGQVAPLKNPASVGNQMKAGIELYFESVNRLGGVGGNKLKLVSKNRVDSSDSAAKTRELVRETRPVALIGMLGTGPMEALVAEGVIAESAIPIIGIRTGATSLHSPLNPWLFHTRANYGVEIRKMVEHLAPIGYKQFAVFYENTAFGLEGLQNAETAINDRKLSLVAKVGFDKSAPDFDKAVATLNNAQPDTILAIGETNAIADFYRALRRAGNRAQVVTLSTVDAAAVVTRIGEKDAYGLGIAQVVPDPLHRKNAISREYQDNGIKLRKSSFEPTQAGLEGYIAAKVLVEGIKLAGANFSGIQLRTALEKLSGLDLGGMIIQFSSANHSGSSFVNVGIIGSNGKLLQ